MNYNIILYFNELTVTWQIRRTSLSSSGLSHWIASQVLLFRFASDVPDLQSFTTSCRTLDTFN